MNSTTTRFAILFLLVLNSFFALGQLNNSLKDKEFEKASYKENAIIVDVRTPLEWRAGIITGAKLQSVDEVDSFTAAIQHWDRSKTYLLYCNTGKRSQLALKEMQSAGFTNVYDLSGGFTAWKTYKAGAARKIQLPIHKLVIQLSIGDTLSWKALMNNLRNLQEAWGYTSAIKVITHGPGLDLLRIDKTTQQDRITHFSKLGIEFFACENSLRERSVSKEQIIKEAGFVKSGIAEVVQLQEAGWSYIKSGF